MSTAQTLREPKAERLRSSVAPPSIVETDEPETAQDRYDRWCRECTERRRQAGLPDDDPITMDEIVAIVKEVRAEMYAEEQEQKKAACR